MSADEQGSGSEPSDEKKKYATQVTATVRGSEPATSKDIARHNAEQEFRFHADGGIDDVTIHAVDAAGDDVALPDRDGVPQTVVLGSIFDSDGEFVEARVYEDQDAMYEDLQELEDEDWFGEMRHQPQSEVRSSEGDA